MFLAMSYRFCLLLLSLLPVLLLAQTGPSPGMETFINQHVQRYAVSPTNRLRVSAFTELRGRPAHQGGGLQVDFGQLGQLTFYQRNCLLLTSEGGVHHIALGEAPANKAQALDQALNQIFEQMLLLSNGPADSAMVAFVDAQLARKTLDPFHKIYARYLMLHHGRYDPAAQTVVVRSEWLGQDALTRRNQHQGADNPLTLRLTREELRGFYHRTQGEVFVHDADRPVAYATGEATHPNVGPFKTFLQKMMSTLPALPDLHARVRREGLSMTFGSSGEGPATTIEPMYHEYSWIPMMLGLLRARDLNFGDPDIVCYFVDQPYFARIYDQLTAEERSAVDAYLRKTGQPRPKV